MAGAAGPGVFTGLALTLAVAAVVVLTAAAGVLLLMVRTKTGIAHYDLGFARWGATHATAGLDRRAPRGSATWGEPSGS